MNTAELTKTVGTEVELNWETFDKLITNNQCKVIKLAEELNIKQSDLRQSLIHHYGDRI
jgi:predicted transcriptional regulator